MSLTSSKLGQFYELFEETLVKQGCSSLGERLLEYIVLFKPVFNLAATALLVGIGARTPLDRF